MDLLAGSDSDSQDKADNGFTINKKYAKSYGVWRKNEEKQRLIDKYGNDFDQSSSSEEEEIRTSRTLDKEWLRAYAVVRFQQPRLYSGEKLFKEEVKPITKKSEKKVTLKDHERKFIIEKGGLASEDEADDNESRSVGPSYFEEQEEIKKSLKKAIGDLDDDEDKEDTLLVKKTKTVEEEKQEENEYLEWLKGDRDDLEDKDAADELAPLKAYWNDPNLTDKEKVLRDYILNNGYMDKEGSDEESEDDDDIDFDEEEEFLGEADKYEKTYNFRHEEPGGIEIKTYPRMIETSVRAKEDNPRVEKRKRKAERLQREKEQRQEEIKTLQRLQMEEKEQKLQKLKEQSEIPELEINLDTDFDPEEHDKIMKKYFNDTYYGDQDTVTKPEFDEEEGDGEYGDEADDWWQSRTQAQMDVEEGLADQEGLGEEELYADDPGFVMDADYDPKNAEKIKQSKKEAKTKKKDKKKKKLDKAPLFDPTTKSFDEYLDEYLKDKINRLPFTYREVIPNDYGLATNEILTAPDRELNSWVSVKKMSAYLTDQEEKHDYHKFKQKSANLHKKHKVLPSLAPQQIVPEKPDIKTKKKKQKKKQKGEDGSSNKCKPENDLQEEQTEKSDKALKKKVKKRKREDDMPIENAVKEQDTEESVKKSKAKKIKLEGGKSVSHNVSTIHPENDLQEERTETSDKALKKKAKKRQREDDMPLENAVEEQDTEESVKKSKVKKIKLAGGKVVSHNVSTIHSPPIIKSKELKHKNESKKNKKSSIDSDRKSEFNTDEVASSIESKLSKKSEKSGKISEIKDSDEPMETSLIAQNSKDNSVSCEHVTVKKKKSKSHKKKKSKLKLDDSDTTEHQPLVADKKKAKDNLKKVMSASRLSSFGLGPGGNRNTGKNIKKKKKVLKAGKGSKVRDQ